MNQYKGIAEIEVLGKKRGFKFGMGAFAELCRIENSNLTEVTDKIINGDIKTQLTLLHCAAVQYSKLNKEEIPTQEEVNDWVDQYGFVNFVEIITGAFKVLKNPNTEAPMEGQ